MPSKTIQIFLKDGDVNGVKIASLSNGLAKIYVVPRSIIEFVQSREDLTKPSLYLLFDDERTTVYIGETENFQNRVIQHLMNKSFWSWAVICVSVGEWMDKADVKFLESHAIQKAIEIGRVEVQNKTSPTKNNLWEFKLATIIDLFDDYELLLTTLGYNLFTPFVAKDDQVIDIPPKTSADKDIRQFDTIIGPATGNGRIEAFEKKNAWWAVRIGEANIPKLKYVGLYESSPISAIRVFAKITKIEPSPESPGKYIIHNDGDIQTLEHPVVLGENPELALYGPRYYKIEDIKQSKTLIELTERTFGLSS